MTTNLFQHPEWTTANPDGSPSGWAFTFANQLQLDSPITGGIPQETMPLPNQTHPFHRPRITTTVGLVSAALESNPVWAGVAQLFTVSVGAVYKLSVKILPDLSHNGTPAGQDSSECRLVARGASSWLSPIVGAINPYEVTFTADQTTLNIGFEFRTRFSLSHIRWVLSEPTLVLVSAAPVSPGGSTPPNGTGGTGGATDPTATPNTYSLLTKKLTALGYQVSILGDEVESLRLALQAAQSELSRIANG